MPGGLANAPDNSYHLIEAASPATTRWRIAMDLRFALFERIVSDGIIASDGTKTAIDTLVAATENRA